LEKGPAAALAERVGAAQILHQVARGQCHADIGGGQRLAIGFDHRRPAATHLAASGMSPVTTTSPGPAVVGDPFVGLVRAIGDKTLSTSGLAEGRMPPFDTSTMRMRCRVATVSASAFTGQASASI
jgi:hypothetical protein